MAAEMMKAVIFTRYGPAKDVVEVTMVPKPKPGPGEVLVKTAAAAINPVDYKVIRGDLRPILPKVSPPDYVTGTDLSGTIVELGPKTSKFKVGDEVYADVTPANRIGSLAEYVPVPEKVVALKPKNISHVEAAGVPLAGGTSLQALRDHGKLQPGGKVLILGGSGGTGTLAIQIAKALGASFIATTSTNEELVKSLGADEVVNYKTEDFSLRYASYGFDVVYDTVGGRDQLEKARRVLKPKGHFVTIVGDGEIKLGNVFQVARFAATAAARNLRSILGGPSYSVALKATKDSADLDQLREWIEAGKVKPVLDPESPFKFEDVSSAFAKQESHRAKGKLVMQVWEK